VLDSVDYIMLTVADMPGSVHFYRDLLGLDVRHETEGWVELATGSTVLVLQGGGSPQPSREAELQGVPVGGTCTIGFTVVDIDAVHEALTDKGVRFSMAPAQRTPSIRMAICHDPDGTAIAFITRTDLI